MKKRLIGIILISAMILTMLPQFSLTALAASDSGTIDVSDNINSTLPAGVTYGSNLFTIGTGANNSTITVTGATTSNAIAVATGVSNLTLILSNADITSPSGGNSPIDLQGAANVTLQLAAGTTSTMSAINAGFCAGIHVTSAGGINATLTITGTGALNATGGGGSAGIGGNAFESGGTFYINGGTVDATGGNGGTGIGGGSSGAGGNITVSGGTVDATGGDSGAGIGGGNGAGGGTITISGNANVTADSSNGGAGIGGGVGGEGGIIGISGDAIVAAACSLGDGAGIGGGAGGGAGGTITISDNADVAAECSSGNGAGIGGGNNGGDGGTITICDNANVTATGYVDGGGGAGIGGGSGAGGTGGTVTISNNAKVVAFGGYGGAGIGGGNQGTGGIISISPSAVVSAVSFGAPYNKPAIDAAGGSGNVINAELDNEISGSVTTYLNCNSNVLSLPAGYKCFAFNAATASAVNVYSDSGCNTLLGNIATDPAGATIIPVTDLSSNPAGNTAVKLTAISVLDVGDSSGTNLPKGVTYLGNLFTIGTDANNSTITVTGTTTINAIAVATGVSNLTLILNGVNITSPSGGKSPIDLQGTASVTIQLANSSTNILNASGANYVAGLCVPSTATAAINGTTGSLAATGGLRSAGIGGSNVSVGGTISISGGTVYATGGDAGAGIGGGFTKGAGNITISGGTVTASGTTGSIGGGAGIGSGYSGTGGTVTISGGTVNATGGDTGAGIGGGGNGGGGVNITISGGTVTAAGGNIKYTGGAGIGGGSGGAGGNITINGSAMVTAIGSYSGCAGIGGGDNYGVSGIVNISGTSTVMAAAVGGSGRKRAIDAASGSSSGTVMDAQLDNFISSSVKYLKCNGNVLPLPGYYTSFAFSAAASSTVNAFSDSGCTAFYGSIVTNPAGATNIPVSNIKIYSANGTSVKLYQAKVYVNKDGSYWRNGTPDIQLSTLDTSLTNAVTGTCSIGVYTFIGIDAAKTYYVWDVTGNKYTGQSVTNSSASRTLSYYTVTLTTGTGIVSTTGSDAYLSGSNASIDATVASGYTWSKWTQTAGGADVSTIRNYQITNIAAPLGYTANTTKNSVPDATSPLASFTPVTLTQTGDVAHNNVQYKTAASVIAALPTQIAVTLVNSLVVNVPVNWADTDHYNAGIASAYTFTAAWGAIPAGANNNNNLPAPTVEVTVAAGVADTPPNTPPYTPPTEPTSPATSPASSPATTQSAIGVDIIVNGDRVNAGTAADSKEGERSVTIITVDQQKLNQKLAIEGNNALVIVPIDSNSDKLVGRLNGQMVKDMEGKQATLEVRTGSATYTLPASEINIDAVSAKLGTNVTLANIIVQIEIASPYNQTVTVVKRAAEDGGFSLTVPAVDFNISCTYNGKTVDVTTFNAYVERTVAIPDGVDYTKITTGIVVNPDGSVRHVPTKVTIIGGKYYAVINSLTNSTYTVIWHPVEFSDVRTNWAGASINDMGSRMVVNGIGNNKYNPNLDITRAEFAAIIVRALGLAPGTGMSSFRDVEASKWYCGYIQTASAYGIIQGYNSTTFGPNDRLTREQAMTMIARAMKITGLKSELKVSEISSLFAKYSDGPTASDYARASIAACLKTGIITGRNSNTIAPKSWITRAEVAVIVQRLLQKSGLI